MSACSIAGCPRAALSRGLCRTCYDRQRNYEQPVTEDRVVYRRARQRATAELLKRHADEFEVILQATVRQVRLEVDNLREHGDGNVVKLKPGPRPAGETAVDRIDVGNCPDCASHHDRGHECPTCHALAGYEADLDLIAIERVMKGEHLPLTRDERAEVVRRMTAMGAGAGQIADRLHLSGATARRLLAEAAS